jgi:hypothetical protein
LVVSVALQVDQSMGFAFVSHSFAAKSSDVFSEILIEVSIVSFLSREVIFLPFYFIQ